MHILHHYETNKSVNVCCSLVFMRIEYKQANEVADKVVGKCLCAVKCGGTGKLSVKIGRNDTHNPQR